MNRKLNIISGGFCIISLLLSGFSLYGLHWTNRVQELNRELVEWKLNLSTGRLNQGLNDGQEEFLDSVGD